MANVKTAISLQKALFERADDMARDMSISRSRLFALALEDYIEKQQNRKMLEQLNRAHADGLDQDEIRLLRAAKKTHRRIVDGEW
jgi:metal-responsive CopG/Arc/MetJ family transcriptional regulator